MNFEHVLESWKQSPSAKVDLSGLFSRNPIAHKWKAPWRSLLLRESVCWRLHDLLSQSYALHGLGHTLGARILLRSGFETLAMLIHLNQLTANVLAGSMNFHAFSDKTSQLLLGSKDQSTQHVAINIVTVLGHCDKRYPGLAKWYADLSESAHPNYEGMLIGYSEADQENHVTTFSNRWATMYGASHLNAMEACMILFEAEYGEVWVRQFEEFEVWIEKNDAMLEATKVASG